MKLGIQDNLGIDLQRNGGGILLEEGLGSAVLISLLTDRRALPEDRLPDDTPAGGPIPPDRRGWCGDALAEIDGDRYGSRLWLLRREKQTEETRQRALFYAREALDWMVEDGHVIGVEVTAEWQTSGRLALSVTLTLPDGSRFKSVVTIRGFHAV